MQNDQTLGRRTPLEWLGIGLFFSALLISILGFLTIGLSLLDVGKPVAQESIWDRLEVPNAFYNNPSPQDLMRAKRQLQRELYQAQLAWEILQNTPLRHSNPPPDELVRLFASIAKHSVVEILLESDEGPAATGSGFLVQIDDNAIYLVTARHVLAGSTDPVSISVAGSICHTVTDPFFTDRARDIAVIPWDRTRCPTVKPLRLVPKNFPSQGDGVAFLCALPEKFPDPVSIGAYMGTLREFPLIDEWLAGFPEEKKQNPLVVQTYRYRDNRGCSGGPLLNQSGDVIGVTIWNLHLRLVAAMPSTVVLDFLSKIPKPEEDEPTSNSAP